MPEELIDPESIEAGIAQAIGEQEPGEESPPEPAPETEAEGEAVASEEPALEGPEPQPEAEGDWVTFSDDRRYERQTALAMAELYDFLQANPEFSRAMAAYATGQFTLTPRDQQVPQASAAEAASEEDEYLDPGLRALRDEVRSLRETVGSYQANSQVAAVSSAADAFRSSKGLSEAEMGRLVAETQRLGILRSIASEQDGLGGPKHSAVSAATEAFERTYWTVPEFRQREMNRSAEDLKGDRKRQHKQAALSGNSGSVPRTTPKPKTEDEAWQMVVAELEAADRGE